MLRKDDDVLLPVVAVLSRPCGSVEHRLRSPADYSPERAQGAETRGIEV